jgi:peptide/nickel transport system permease protein
MAIAGTAELASVDQLRPPQRWPTLRVLVRKKLAMAAIVYLCIFYFCGIFAPLIAPHDYTQTEISREARLQGPSSEHWFGTDQLGRDLLSRSFFAARTTILFTLAVLITGGVFLGLGLGLLAGYRGGWVDTAIMRVGEVLGGLPTLIIILAITAAFRTRLDTFAYDLSQNTPLSLEDAKTLTKFVIIVGASVPFAWIGSARIVRSQALSIRESTFVLSAEAVGASTWRVLTRHILPGVMPLFMVGLSGGMAAIAGSEVALSFLGLGIDAPAASFGNMIEQGAGVRAFETYPHLLLVSALPVILFLYAWTLLGDALVDILEPRTTVR